jgi:hypothetical protein
VRRQAAKRNSPNCQHRSTLNWAQRSRAGLSKKRPKLQKTEICSRRLQLLFRSIGWRREQTTPASRAYIGLSLEDRVEMALV